MPVPELNSPQGDFRPSLRADGLEILFDSNRPGPPDVAGLGLRDIWVSRRRATWAPWSAPINLGPVVNTPFNDDLATLSGDGTTMVFVSDRPGGFWRERPLHLDAVAAMTAPAHPTRTGAHVMRHAALRTTAAGLFAGLFAAAALGQGAPVQTLNNSFDATAPGNPVLEWNQIFIDTLVAAAPPNITGPRLGAIVQAAVFDADNGIEQRYTPLFVARRAPDGASPDAAVVAAAYTALVGLFPSQQATLLDPAYAASLEALRERCPKGPRPNAICEKRIQDGIDWGTDVAHAILAMRANDGFSGSYPAFVGGTAIGQWRPTPPAFGPMSAQSLAFTDTFVLASSTQFQPERPRTLGSPVFSSDFNAVKALGRRTGSTRTDDQTALAPFWEGSASVHWNQAANQMAEHRHLSMSQSARLFATLNIAMADTSITIWTAKRFYGSVATEVTWRPVTAIPLAESDGNPDTAPDLDWLPLMTTPSHPEYPAGHPSLNGAGATVLLRHFNDRQTFTLTTAGQPSRTYTSIKQARADGNNARIWGGMHYPSTVAISDATGAAIAEYVDRSVMRLVGR